MQNISTLAADKTATTRPGVASSRADIIASWGARTVIELCVGPSLRTLERAYAAHGVTCHGNDIDPRWRAHYPDGSWVIGDAMSVDVSGYDCVVFAPPLSQGCSGKREDALQISDVTPGYDRFIDVMATQSRSQLYVLVLPARSLSTRDDRRQLHRLIGYACKSGFMVSTREALDERQRVRNT